MIDNLKAKTAHDWRGNKDKGGSQCGPLFLLVTNLCCLRLVGESHVAAGHKSFLLLTTTLTLWVKPLIFLMCCQFFFLFSSVHVLGHSSWLHDFFRSPRVSRMFFFLKINSFYLFQIIIYLFSNLFDMLLRKIIF